MGEDISQAGEVAMDLFPVGGPVPPEDVVDREEFIDQLVTRLLDRHSVVLSGPRRLGKSSVAYEVLRRLRADDDCYTAAIDLSTVSTLRDLSERLIAAAMANVSPGVRGALTVWQGLGKLLRMPEVRAKMHELDLTFALRPDEEPRPEVLLDEALGLPERLASRDGRRFVLLFDEFQSATAIGGPTLLAKMRGAFQVQPHTAFLFLGSQAGTMAQLFGRSSQPFFRFATMLDLPPVPDEAWRRYIRSRLAERNIRIEGTAMDGILAYTGGHPYDTMQVAYEAHLLARRSRVIDPRTTLAACAEAQAHLRSAFDAELDALGPRSRVLLGRIVRGEPLYAGERSSGTVDRSLVGLVRLGVIRRIGRGRYEFVEPMLARHVAPRSV